MCLLIKKINNQIKGRDGKALYLHAPLGTLPPAPCCGQVAATFAVAAAAAAAVDVAVAGDCDCSYLAGGDVHLTPPVSIAPGD
jgi:hypothetical protein